MRHVHMIGSGLKPWEESWKTARGREPIDSRELTAIVGYAGVAPSNFGSALGYDAVSVNASATSLNRVADSRLTAER